MDRNSDARTIGITSTVPAEILFAAGLSPVDLNNRFITHPQRRLLIEEAEAAGFPMNSCAWIKGIYAFLRRSGIKKILGVTEGDCSNTHVLLEILAGEGVEVVEFQYPRSRKASHLEAAMARLAETLGTTLEKAEQVRTRMAPLRAKLERLDEMTWKDGKVTGLENHLWLINSSDMRGDFEVFEREVDAFLAEAESRAPQEHEFRLGILGIPPIIDDLHEILRERRTYVVYNEFQRQFSMPGPTGSLVEEYLAYTYPYETACRIADISAEAGRRRLDGLIHYVQSFCYRQLQDTMIRKAVDLPLLTLEFDRPGKLDGRSLTRVEAFLEMLEARKPA